MGDKTNKDFNPCHKHFATTQTDYFSRHRFQVSDINAIKACNQSSKVTSRKS